MIKPGLCPWSRQTRRLSSASTIGKPDQAARAQSPSESGDLSQAGSLFQYQHLNQQVLENPDLDLTPSSQIPTLAGHTPSPLQPEQTTPQPHRGTTPPLPAAPPAVNAQVGKTRSRSPQALPRNLYLLWLMELATAVLVIAVISGGLHLVLQAINRLLRWVQWPINLGGTPAFDRFPLGSVIILAIGLTLASPWLMDLGLARWHRQRPLTTRQLQALRPDTMAWLRQVCRQQGWQLPHLRLVPDPAPLCFSYGWRPGNTRLVISQGLLDSLSEDDLTTLYTYELAHLANGDLPLMSAMGVPLLVLHTAYGQLSRWGDRLSPGLGRLGAGILISGLYGVFWLLRQLVLWFSRVRSEWCDRRAMTFMPSPTALPSGFIHLFAAISTHSRQTGRLHPLLSSLDVLMPVGSQPALSPGSFLTRGGLAQVIAGDYLNPYRRWLMTNASHPLLADRLRGLLSRCVPQGEVPWLEPQFHPFPP
ncbi:MAG: M48 family metalloprotease [Leptolyngbyaceae cyanobacterium SM2_3_12]|nr:M48 family metalloprotease [Leptolyngbyaceae cyanobacterium SM2_3_12]